MKRLLLLFAAVALVACGKDDDGPDVGTRPIKPSAEVQAFFDENAGTILHEKEGDLGADGCIMINRSGELPALVDKDGLPVEYPNIEFDSYTLIVGQWEGGGGLYVESQSLDVQQDVATVSLAIAQRKEEGVDYDTGVYPVFFWALYPKIEATNIEVNVIYEPVYKRDFFCGTTRGWHFRSTRI